MIILLTNCGAIKKVIVVKSQPTQPHAIPRLALALPTVSPFKQARKLQDAQAEKLTS